MSAAKRGLDPRAWIAIGLLLAAAGIAAAGYVGHRQQLQAWSNGATAAAAASAAASQVPRRQRAASAAEVEIAAIAKPAASGALAWPLWEFQLKQPVPPRDPPLTPVPWRLIGATQSGGAWQIVVLRQGKGVPEYFKKGDSLPGGYRIDSITAEDVTLLKGGRPVILSYISSR